MLASVFVMAACSSGGDDESGGDGGGTIRFVFSPDPVWNWLEDQGILAEMEQESGFTIERFESEDEFAFFAGGHADVVSTGSYETPVLESENNVPTVTIGKYNMAKDIVVVAADSGYKTFGRPPEGVQGRASSRSAARPSSGRRWPRTSTTARSPSRPMICRWRSPTSTWLPSSC